MATQPPAMRGALPEPDDALPPVVGALRRGLPLADAKLMPPRLRRGAIDRTRLIRLLADETGPPIVSVVAPPGYGKTTLLAQWAARDRSSVAWVTLDDLDNDPLRLVTYLAAAFRSIRRIPPSANGRGSLFGTHSATGAMETLTSGLQQLVHPTVLILDDAHRLTDRSCLETLVALLNRLPTSLRVAIAGRTEPELPLARFRAQGNLLEIGRGLLALDESETAALTWAAGCQLDADEIRSLTARTEGWPAGTYLAALSMLRGMSRPVDAGSVSGVDPYIAAYFRSEFERGVDDSDVALLTRTSILESISPAIAEAITGVPEAGRRLRVLAHENQLIQELGPAGRSYRYHNLLRDFLKAELERREPGATPVLQRRAAEWYAAGGRFDRALDLAASSGDVILAARIVTMASGVYGRIGLETMSRWLDRFDASVFERYPPLAVVAAWTYLLTGRAEAADRMADIAERATFNKLPADGSASFESQRAGLLAMMARHGPRQMLAHARFAASQEGAESRWRPSVLLMLGAAHRMLGETDAADRAFREAVIIGASSARDAALVALAARASIRIEAGDWVTADGFMRQGRQLVDVEWDASLPGLIVHAVDARVAILRGDIERAMDDLSRAQRALPLANHAAPWLSVDALLDIVQAYLSLSDPANARPVLRQAEQIIRRRPNLGILTTRLVQVRQRVAEASSTLLGSSAFTPTELRVLPFLATYLSFQEIADRLAISRNTVKTHAMSIYGKLWASSRGEAVRRAVELGLLEPHPLLQAAASDELPLPDERLPVGDDERLRVRAALEKAEGAWLESRARQGRLGPATESAGLSGPRRQLRQDDAGAGRRGSRHDG